LRRSTCTSSCARAGRRIIRPSPRVAHPLSHPPAITTLASRRS
jgi:hypothetical protein